MKLLDNLRGRIAAARVVYQASYERTLGEDVWTKIKERRQDFPPDYALDMKRAIDRSDEMSVEAWHQLVGEIARECPKDIPRHLRLRWVVKQLSWGVGV